MFPDLHRFLVIFLLIPTPFFSIRPARAEITTGEFVGSEVFVSALADELDRLAPSELLLPDKGVPPEHVSAVVVTVTMNLIRLAGGETQDMPVQISA